jgi:hypothetical protein
MAPTPALRLPPRFEIQSAPVERSYVVRLLVSDREKLFCPPLENPELSNDEAVSVFKILLLVKVLVVPPFCLSESTLDSLEEEELFAPEELYDPEPV